MSKQIQIVKCSRCKRILYRQEFGSRNNKNGILTSNTRLFLVTPNECRYCQEDKNDEQRKKTIKVGKS